MHATPSINLIKKFFFASIGTIADNATREYFSKPLVILLNLFLSFDGQSYQSTGLSEYSHGATYGIANYRGKALTTGCYFKSCGLKTELMDMTTLTWSAGPDYPSQWTSSYA